MSKELCEATTLEQLCRIDIRKETRRFRTTGVICTIGPSCRSVEKLKEMINSGMNIARLNFSHGTHEYHGETIKNIREACKLLADDVVVAIALDTKGPEIRTGLINGSATAEVELRKGETVRITTDGSVEKACNAAQIYVDYKNITKVVKKGAHIYIDDGLISLIANEIGNDAIMCTIENGGMLGSRKGVNLPGTPCDLPALSERDKGDLQFGVEQDVDIIFASFIRNADNVREIRKALGEKGKYIKIISKIESQEGVDNADEIVKVSDGIMVARGDLGIEIPAEKVFAVQKMLIARCNAIGKPVICATQMLESMTKKPRPTRAEGSDVANAVLDGADCVMLSGETAKGAYPVITLQTMARICLEAELITNYTKTFEEALHVTLKPTDSTHTIAIGAAIAVNSCEAVAIIACTTTGRAAALVSRYRPKVPIIAVSRNGQVSRQLHLWRAVIPAHYKEPKDPDFSVDIEKRIQFGIDKAKSLNIVRPNDIVIALSGSLAGPGHTNTMRIMTVK